MPSTIPDPIETIAFNQYKILKFKSLDSTQSRASEMMRSGKLAIPAVITADYQSTGRGQMQTHWQANPGENLLATLVIEPRGLLVENRFSLSMSFCLAAWETLTNYGLDAQIKWPNDLIVDRKKIGGILIENALRGDKITLSMLGLGLNVNQDYFDGLPHAVSMKQVLGTDKPLHRDEILKTLLLNFDKWDQLRLIEEGRLLYKTYMHHLMGFKTPEWFKTGADLVFSAQVRGIQKDGRIELLEPDGHLRTFDLKQVQMLL